MTVTDEEKAAAAAWLGQFAVDKTYDFNGLPSSFAHLLRNREDPVAQKSIAMGMLKAELERERNFYTGGSDGSAAICKHEYFYHVGGAALAIFFYSGEWGIEHEAKNAALRFVLPEGGKGCFLSPFHLLTLIGKQGIGTDVKLDAWRALVFELERAGKVHELREMKNGIVELEYDPEQGRGGSMLVLNCSFSEGSLDKRWEPKTVKIPQEIAEEAQRAADRLAEKNTLDKKEPKSNFLRRIINAVKPPNVDLKKFNDRAKA